MPTFTANNVATNYLSGRRNAQEEQYGDVRNVLGQQAVQQNQQALAAAPVAAEAEQKAAHAKKLFLLTQYGLQSATPKAFVEQNAPELVQMAGPSWATATDEQVKQNLQDLQGKLGAEVGVGPAQPKGASGVLYKYKNKDGKIVYGDATEASGQEPYVYMPPKGGTGTNFDVMTPEEVDDAGLPVGTVAQRGSNGKVMVLSKPDAGPGSKPPTEGDKRARVMYRSMQNAEKQLESVTSSDTSDLGQAILGKVNAGKVLQSQEYKRYEAAGLRWAANLLYLKSGATATPDEIRSTYLQFLPQPGDGQGVKDQKNEARAQELGAINEAYSFEAPRSGNVPPPGAPAIQPAAAPAEQTATGPNGQKIALRNGKWVPL